MKIFVTGGAGFIGSAVIRQAVENGDEIINFDALTYAANLKNLMSVETKPNYHFIHGNIRDGELLRDIFKRFEPDAVMHLAAESHVDRSIDGPYVFVETNIIGTFSLLQAVRTYWGGLSGGRKDRFRFHHVSTDEVYGDLDNTALAFTEHNAYQPSSPYSASKAASDHLVRAWHKTYGLPVIITNTSNNYGPYQFPEKLIPVTILNILNDKEISIYGNGDNIRDWLYVEDHAEALLQVLKAGNIGETYNIGGNCECTNLNLVKKICEVMNETLRRETDAKRLIAFVKDRPGHDRRYAIDSRKLYKELNWRAKTSLDLGLHKTVDWYMKNENWWRPLLLKGKKIPRLGQAVK